MAVLGTQFDPNAVPPAAPREIVPPGKYLAHIVASEMKATKDQNGQFLYLEFAILDGPYTNKKLYARLNLINANATAVDIANRELADICLATGSGVISDSEQLHWKPIIVTVKVEPPKGNYAASNSISGYEPAGGQRPAAPPTQQHQQNAQPSGPPAGYTGQPPQQQRPPVGTAVGGSVPPWKRAAAA